MTDPHSKPCKPLCRVVCGYRLIGINGEISQGMRGGVGRGVLRVKCVVEGRNWATLDLQWISEAYAG